MIAAWYETGWGWLAWTAGGLTGLVLGTWLVLMWDRFFG